VPNTPIYGLPYPSLSDPPHGPDQLEALALGVEDELFRIDNELGALQSVPVAQSASASAAVSTASATYVALAGDPGVAFVAPSTGRIIVSWGCTFDGNAAAVFGMAAVQIRSGSTIGSGTIFAAASDNDAIGYEGSNAAQFGRTIMFSGLSAAQNYNAQVLYKLFSGAGTAFFARRNIVVRPTT
jgi:hypothetical protein